jgi:cellulose synthase (UDP-forming)
MAPQTLNAFSVQRLRWAQGSMQLLRSRENPLIVPGLTFAQRLNYFASMSTYFEAYQKLIFLVAAPIVLLTGVIPIKIDGIDFLAHWLPYVVLTAIANGALGRGHYRHWMAERYNLLKTFIFLRASLVLVWPGKLGFRVTPKQLDQSVYAQERINLLPHAVAISLVVLSIGVGIMNLLWGFTTSYSDVDMVAVTVLWSLANVGLMFLAVRDVLRRRHSRQDYRFPARVSASVAIAGGLPMPATTENLSRHGIGLVARLDADLGAEVKMTLGLPDGPLSVGGRVVYRGDLAQGEQHLGVRFSPLCRNDRARLLTYLFVTVSRQQRARDNESRSAPAWNLASEPTHLHPVTAPDAPEYWGLPATWRLTFAVDEEARGMELRMLTPILPSHPTPARG